MRNKLITLCLNSYELAQKKPNFSQWVRNKLLDEVAIPKKKEEEHLFTCFYGCQRVKEGLYAPKCRQHDARMKIVESIPLEEAE
jgi:hypothetical protein